MKVIVKDKLTTRDRGIAMTIICILLLVFGFLSCGPNHLDDRQWEQIIVDPHNPEVYQYSYKGGTGWDERPNVQSKIGSEEGYFWFTTDGNTVTLSKTGRMAEVRYYPVANAPDYITLEVVDNVVIKENVTPNGTFRTYGSLDH